MTLDDLGYCLISLEPGMTLSVPEDWVLREGAIGDRTARDGRIAALARRHGCTWRRDGAAHVISKQGYGSRRPPRVDSDVGIVRPA